MKKIILFVAGLLSLSAANAQTWNWAASIGGKSSDGVAAIEKDAAGNIYVLGDFEGNKIIGTSVYSAQGLSDCFLTKYSSTGTPQWTVQINGSSPTNIMEAGSVAVDSIGNIYVGGNFSSEVVLGGTPFFSNFTGDGFVAKYSSSGSFVWAAHLSGTGNEKITTLKCLGTDVYVGGNISQAATIGTFTFPAPSTVADDAIIFKLDSSGNVVWGLNAGGNGQDQTMALSVSNTAIYWAGFFSGTANFLGTSLIAPGTGTDMYVIRLNDSGQMQWAKRIGGVVSEQINGVTQDNSGNPICTGIFYGDVTFETGIILREAHGPQTNAGNGDAFVCKLSQTNGSCQWARHIRCINGDNNEFGSAIINDPGGSSYVTGAFNGTTRFSSSGTTTQTGTDITSAGGKDAFIAKYDGNGNLLWVTKAGGAGNDIGKSILWEPNGICVVGGYFTNTLTIGSSTLNAAAGLPTIFLAKYDGLTADMNETVSSFPFDVFPNPARDYLFVQTSPEHPVEKAAIYSIEGMLIREFEIDRNPVSAKIRFDLGPLTPGFYLLNLQSGKDKSSRKITVY